MKSIHIRAGARRLLPLLAAVVGACGGGGGGAEAPAEATPAGVVVSGSIVKGPVAGATVCAFELAGAGKGRSLGCATTQADGSYRLTLDYTGPVLLEATGGSYTDEASGTPNVPLATPLTAIGLVGTQGNVVVATPLTSLAVQRALARGPLSVERFDAAAAEVAAAFGLPAGVRLAGQLPDVTGGSDAYGNALVGLSRMLGRGATLAGVLANGNLEALKPAYQQVTTGSLCSGPAAGTVTLATGVEAVGGAVTAPGSVEWTGEPLPGGGMSLRVTDPIPAWRAMLPPTGMAMGCEVVANTATEVQLACSAAALAPGLTLITDAALQALPATLPSAGVLVAGHTIRADGAMPTMASVFAPSVSLGGTGASGGAVTLTPPAATVGSIPPAAGAVCLSGGSLSASGALQVGGGTVTSNGSGGIVVPTGGGQVQVSSSGGGLVLNGAAAASGVQWQTFTPSGPDVVFQQPAVGVLTQPAEGSGSRPSSWPRLLVTATSSGKVYDGAVQASTLNLSGLVGEAVTFPGLPGTATFASKDVTAAGIGTLVIRGPGEASNYSLHTFATTSGASIQPRVLSITSSPPQPVFDATPRNPP